MKRFFSFLALLCLFFGAAAQENITINTSGAAASPLKIGDKVPAGVLSGLSKTAALQQKGSGDLKAKLLVLDFWATWCAPCVAMIPQMNTLQESYHGKIQLLPVAYQSRKEVETFLNRLEQQRGIKEQLPLVTGDTSLVKLFPHAELPHLVWIGPDGIVKAITGPQALNKAVIDRLLAGDNTGMKIKRDEVMTYDRSSNLLIDPSATEPGVSFAVSGYKEGVGRGYYNDTMIPGEGKERRMTARNQTIPELYLLAYSKKPKEVVLEVADTTALASGNLSSDDFREWLKQGHGFCVELVLPDSLRKRSYEILKSKLNAYFSNYSTSLEKRHVRCLALVRTSGADKLKSAGEKPAVEQDAFGSKFTNCYLRVFISRMQLPLQYHPLPLKDETGYTGKVDLQLSGDLSNLAELNRELAKYDLRFEERAADLEMLVIRDAVSSKP